MNKDPNPVHDEFNKSLELVNSALNKLGSELKYIKSPEYLPEYDKLKGKKIIIIDDVLLILENVLPDLVIATDGNAEAINYNGQSLENLVMELMDKKPDILILDYHLSNTLKGVHIIEALKRLGFKGKFIGASSESDKSKEFVKAGAVGNFDKGAYPISDAIKHLAEIC